MPSPSNNALDGQEQVFGVHVREHHSQIPAGYGAGAVNMRFRKGVPETALGTTHLGWLNNTTAAGIGKYTTIYGEGRFLDADRNVWNLKAADGAVYASLPNNFPLALTLPAGVTVTEECSFEQLDDTVIMMRGDDADPLQMTSILQGFIAVPDPAPGLGLSRIPRGRQALAVGRRLWILTGTDGLWASDPFDHTTYPPDQKWRVTDGVPDACVVMALFNESSIVVLKDKSVWRMVNVIGDLGEVVALRVTRRYGCVAAKSVVDIGTDLMWWSQDGPASLTITEFNEVQTGQGKRPMPGLNIDGLLARVNKLFRAKICAGFWDNKVYFAVPLDDASSLRFDWVNGVTSQSASNTMPLEANKTYRYAKVSAETNVVIGTTLLTASMDASSGATGDGSFTVPAPVTLTSTVREVLKGVNNAVLVLDTLLVTESDPSGSWQGYDQREGVEPKQFFLSPWLGEDRLCFSGEDGWTCLYEEGYEDAHPTPYVDLTVSSAPANGNTLAVNGGTTAVSNTAFATNAVGTRWGTGTLANARANIWADVNELGGYYHDPANFWTSPSAAPVRITNGVRFYGLDGRMPAVVTTGAWATLAYTRWQQIESSFTTRGLTTPDRLRDKRSLELVLVLETWNPLYDIFVAQDGVNEESQPAADATRSRVAYDKPFNKADWVATNVSDDFATPYRQDYSLDLASGPGFKLGTGLGVGLHQERRHDLGIHGRGRSPRVRIVNKQGRVRLLALGYEGVNEGKRMRRDS